MIEWLKNRLYRIDYALLEFPKLYWITVGYLLLACVSAFAYQQFLLLIVNVTIDKTHLFVDFFLAHEKWLFVGQIILPCLIFIFGCFNVVDYYERLCIKKYGKVPEWI